MDKYSWNFDKDAECWCESENTIQDCIEAAKASYDREDNQFVYIGENVPFVPTVDAGSILERIHEEAYDFSELAEDWYPESAKQEDLDELSAQLTPILQAWLEKHNYKPNFWQIQNVKRYDLEDKS